MRYELFIHPARFIRLLPLAVLLPALSARADSPPTGAALQLNATAAVRDALAANSAAPRIRLLDTALVAHRLTLNFSRELLDLGLGTLAFEEFSAGVNRAAGDALRGALATFEIDTAVEGVPLPRLFASLDAAALISAPRPPFPPRAAADPAPLPLAGRRLAISPGHGYYFTGTRWALQRPFLTGIVEDFVNHDFVSQLNALLLETGADVRPTRNLDRTAGPGESGFPLWQEAARYHVKALGADPSVWNEPGFDHLDQDIRCRPRYANAIAADLLVSIHNNAGGGTGTETLYDNANASAAESKRLADLLHAKVIAAIRRDYHSAWVDRRVQGFNGSYGENRLATRPAVIMEIAFMDKPVPDNAALQDDRFKLLVATAIRDGIREYLVGPLPAAPAALIATGDATGISLAWTDLADNETGFRVERKAGPAGAWSALATVTANLTSYRDPTAATGVTYLYRVAAFNVAGNSEIASNEAAAALTTVTPALILASVTPILQTRDWTQDAVFTLTVTDAAGRPVGDASILVQDGLRNSNALPAADRTDANGQFVYRSTVPSGQGNTGYIFIFQATKPGYTASAPTSRQALVDHPEALPLGAPNVFAQPAAQSLAAGARATFSVTASGSPPLFYQWRFNATDLPGANSPTLSLPAVTPAQAGAYSLVVTNRLGSVTSLAAPLLVNPAAWLSNLSVRTTLATGQNVIVGFVVGGGTKDLLVRAAGPALASFGLATALADPRLELYRGTAKISENNDWPAALAPAFTAVGAFPFPTASRDAALLQPLGGPHTVQASGTGPGIVLIEVYDTGDGGAIRLINLSARNRVGTGADILIAGFFVSGTGTQRVLIRAIGPALSALGVPAVLADPKLEVHDATGRIAENDNWEASLAPVFSAVGAFPLPPASKDAALVLTLTAGRSYTVQVSGVNAGIGEALVEVYEVP